MHKTFIFECMYRILRGFLMLYLTWVLERRFRHFSSPSQNPLVQPPSPHANCLCWYGVDSGRLPASLWSRLELVCCFLKEPHESLFPKPPSLCESISFTTGLKTPLLGLSQHRLSQMLSVS